MAIGVQEVHPDTLAALGAPFYPVVLVHVDWPGDPVRVHSGKGDLVWSGETWAGVGASAGISLPADRTGTASFPGTLTVGGLPAEIDGYLQADAMGRLVEIFFGCVTSRAGNVLIGAPWPTFIGVVDGLSDEQSSDARQITVDVRPGPPQRAKAAAVVSDGWQRSIWPDDTAGRWLRAALAKTSAEVAQW